MDDDFDVGSWILLKTSNSVESAGRDFGRDLLDLGVGVTEIRPEKALRP